MKLNYLNIFLGFPGSPVENSRFPYPAQPNPSPVQANPNTVDPIASVKSPPKHYSLQQYYGIIDTKSLYSNKINYNIPALQFNRTSTLTLSQAHSLSINSPMVSEPGGKSESKSGSPCPLILATTACLKCHRRS